MPLLEPLPTEAKDIKELMDKLARYDRILRGILNGRVESENMFEVGGWRVKPDILISKDGDVGMSTEDTAADDIRIFAGPDGAGGYLYYVTKGGLMVAQNASIRGIIEALSGHIGGFTIEADKLSSDSGAGIIEGGTIVGALIKTAYTGARIELTGGVLKGYSEAGNLHGLVFNPTPVSNFFDLFLYHDGTQMLEFYDEGTMIKIRPGSGTSSWSLGKVGGITYLDGEWIFNSTASLDLGPNTATGKVQYAGFADAAGTSGSADSVDWSDVTNHPDPTTLPRIDGTAAIGSSDKYAYSDHVHPTDTSRSPVVSPNFTGIPTAPTAAVGTNTTQLATMAALLARSASGEVTVNISAASFGSAAVVFPVGRFASAPIVVVSSNTLDCYAISDTSTGAGVTVYAVQRDGTSVTKSVTVRWIAQLP